MSLNQTVSFLSTRTMFLHLSLEKIAHHSVYTIGHAINPPGFTRKFKEESGSVSWFRILNQTSKPWVPQSFENLTKYSSCFLETTRVLIWSSTLLLISSKIWRVQTIPIRPPGGIREGLPMLQLKNPTARDFGSDTVLGLCLFCPFLPPGVMKNTELLLLFWQRNRVSPNSLNPFPNLRIRVGWGPAALLPSACAGRFLNRQFRGVGAHGSKQMGMGVNGNCLWLDLFLRVFSHDFIETSLITSDDLWGWQTLNMHFFFCKLFTLPWGISDSQCCDSFRWTSKGLSHTNTRSVQSLSRVHLFVTPCAAAHQVSLSITSSQSLLKLIPSSWWCHPAFIPLPDCEVSHVVERQGWNWGPGGDMKDDDDGTLLVVQWLRLYAPNAGGSRFNPWLGN